jgi:hypothetical protein
MLAKPQKMQELQKLQGATRVKLSICRGQWVPTGPFKCVKLFCGIGISLFLIDASAYFDYQRRFAAWRLGYEPTLPLGSSWLKVSISSAT